MKFKYLLLTFLFIFIYPLWGQLKIYTIGDSTVQDYNDGYSPRKGWGQMLQHFFNPSGVTVTNKAVGGTSSKSFYNLFWKAIRDNLKTGDYVLIQFGINDRNSSDTARYAPAPTIFKDYIRKYVSETKAKGAIPILVSTVRRNSWSTDLIPYDAYHDHPVAMRELASELSVPLVDLDQRCYDLFVSQGKLYATRHITINLVAGEYTNYPNGNTDDVHYQETGATDMARYVCDAIKSSSNTDLQKLVPFLKPQYQVTVNINDASKAQTITRTTTFPEGIPVTLKTIAQTNATFLRWENASGTQVSTKSIYIFTMGNSATSYTAIYQTNNPIVNISSPSTGTTFNSPATVSITANASSPSGSINKVEFYNGTTKLGEDNSSPYSYTWSDVPAGTYSLTAVATDANNNKTTSAPVSITVNANLDCAGVDGGQAYLDECGICVGGTTGKNACLVSIQAEDACTYDGSIDSNNAGFKGTGFVNLNNANGSQMKIIFISEQTVSLKMEIRYANGGTSNRSMNLSVNGNSQLLNFEPSGSWTTWNYISANCSFSAGTNEIILSSNTDDGGPNIDMFAFESSSVSVGSCTADCNGVIGGTAYFDDCNICVAGNTGKTACVTQTINLNAGWNLFSINVIPDNNSVETVFADIIQELVLIKNTDSFWLNNRNTNYNSLKSITAGKGYIANMKSAKILSVKGTPISILPMPANTLGWKLIGCPYPSAISFSTIYNSSNCEIIKNFEGIWIPNGSSNTINNIEPGKAYFIKIK